jgi:hypothetical protein
MAVRYLTLVAFTFAGIAMCLLTAHGAEAVGGEQKAPLSFSGGHDIGKNDYGRPCVLMAAALGVETDVFRKAFSGVTPAKGRGPSREEAQKNKAALMKVLAPYGVTNERMDEVANYYRFKPQDGELWPTTEAKGYAVVEGGKVKKVVITEPGSGYCSEPAVKVEGVEGVRFKVTLGLSKDLKANGTMASVDVVERK